MVTIEFYSVATCAECKAFKKHAIPYFKERYGGKVKIKMYDMDDDGTKKPYDQVIKSLLWYVAFCEYQRVYGLFRLSHR